METKTKITLSKEELDLLCDIEDCFKNVEPNEMRKGFKALANLTSENVIQALACSKITLVRLIMVSNLDYFRLSEEMFYRDEAPEVRVLVALTSTDPEILNKMKCDSNEDVLITVASNSNTQIETLKYLSTSDFVEVRDRKSVV